jgi:hypothetical protein
MQEMLAAASAEDSKKKQQPAEITQSSRPTQ